MWAQSLKALGHPTLLPEATRRNMMGSGTARNELAPKLGLRACEVRIWPSSRCACSATISTEPGKQHCACLHYFLQILADDYQAES